MHIEHCIFLSWFTASPESHEQDGEKLLRIVVMRKQQRLAILPWRSNLALSQEAILIGSCQIAGRAYRRRLNRANTFSRRSTKRTGLERPARNKSSADAELLN
jgi:hypothetical protein